MKPLEVVLVDDEEQGIITLKYDLGKLEFPMNIRSFTNPKEALRVLRRDPPEVLFLDVEMANMNGFQLLDAMKNITFEVIFVTAYDHYAIKAFRYLAVDYLLKPVEPELLKDALERIVHQRQRKENDRIQLLLDKLRSKEEKFTRLAVPHGETFEFINIRDIVHCRAQNNYSTIHMLDGSKHLISKGLSHLQELLDQQGFFRTHKSHLINLDHILKYVKSDGGYIEMIDHSIVSLSRSKREEFINSIKKI
ncbi:MAG: LytTR family DNA-binding domain-containing protein [Bacteroidota bacterium]